MGRFKHFLSIEQGPRWVDALAQNWYLKGAAEIKMQLCSGDLTFGPKRKWFSDLLVSLVQPPWPPSGKGSFSTRATLLPSFFPVTTWLLKGVF